MRMENYALAVVGLLLGLIHQQVVTPITMRLRIGGDLSVLHSKEQSTGMDILMLMWKDF